MTAARILELPDEDGALVTKQYIRSKMCAHQRFETTGSVSVGSTLTYTFNVAKSNFINGYITATPYSAITIPEPYAIWYFRGRIYPNSIDISAQLGNLDFDGSITNITYAEGTSYNTISITITVSKATNSFNRVYSCVSFGVES